MFLLFSIQVAFAVMAAMMFIQSRRAYSRGMREPVDESTVWILGAGFSRALGAPLFRDLFRSDHRVLAACKNTPPEGMRGVLRYYRIHAPEELGGNVEMGTFWRDPEEFLDVVESANSGELSALELLKTDGSTSLEQLADMGKRALAIECSHFLRGANGSTERWLPYRTWAKSLTASDTVITFNYDRVPELLAAQVGGMLQVILPDGEAKEKLSMASAQSCAPVFKLHGSVDWVAIEAKITVDTAEDLPLTSKGRDLVLAVPGPDKIKLREKYKPMLFLWTQARTAIEKATRIVFVGYRFPPTDAGARVELLNAIREAGEHGELRKVQVILGPDKTHRDVGRIEKLLEFVCPPRTVEVLPLYAEDFLAMPREWTS